MRATPTGLRIKIPLARSFLVWRTAHHGLNHSGRVHLDKLNPARLYGNDHALRVHARSRDDRNVPCLRRFKPAWLYSRCKRYGFRAAQGMSKLHVPVLRLEYARSMAVIAAC